MFEKQVKIHPEQIAIIYQDIELTYQHFNSLSNAIANRLIELNVKLDMPVGVFLDRSIYMIVALMAIEKAGGCYVPIDPENPDQRVNYIIEDTGMNVVITTGQGHDRIKQKQSLELLDISSQFPIENFANLIIPNINVDNLTSENLAYIIYTSGSTGKT